MLINKETRTTYMLETGYYDGIDVKECISDNSLSPNALDYYTLGAIVGDRTLCNNIADIFDNYIKDVYNYDYEEDEVFQYFLVSESGAELLIELGEIVYYLVSLDLYVWGITHFGTLWSDVWTGWTIEYLDHDKYFELRDSEGIVQV